MARKSRPSKPRPSKMGRKWTQDDVLAYNTKVVYQDLETFFGVTDLPPPDVESDALTAQDNTTAKDFWTSQMLFHTDRVTDPDNREPATIDFVRELFNVLRYANALQKIFGMMRLKLRHMASQGKPPQVDFCIVDDLITILLVVKVDRHLRGSDPEPRLISDTIAAFHNNNIICAKLLGTNPLTSKVMPGIGMNGSMTTFYKIPVTAELVRAVESGEHPEQETVVHAYRPEVPRPEEGMKPLDNRFIILSCYEAFRKFI
jgi:hypothetical protein